MQTVGFQTSLRRFRIAVPLDWGIQADFRFPSELPNVGAPRPKRFIIKQVIRDNTLIQNPKRGNENRRGKASWYDYYAGFSPAFVRDALRFIGPSADAQVMDPWNGSGTTTEVITLEGIAAFGFDLNPVMVLVAKARLLDNLVKPSLRTILEDLLGKAAQAGARAEPEPLCSWFTPTAAAALRKFEQAIQSLLIEPGKQRNLFAEDLDAVSSLAAFYHVAGFRAIRSFLKPFRSSNPTWLKAPPNDAARIAFTTNSLHAAIREHVGIMIDALSTDRAPTHRSMATIDKAASTKLPLENASIDAVIASPPYCTRIDYVRKTSPELAFLGASSHDLATLRSGMIGTPTIADSIAAPSEAWGPTCRNLMERIANHDSYAARSYYCKTYAQYFDGMARSLSEIDRTLKHKASVLLVVQDSHFKDVHVDLVTVIKEMVHQHNWNITLQADFPISRTMAALNPRARALSNRTVETVIGFQKA